MTAGDVLMEVAAARYLYDTTAGAPQQEETARSLAAGAAGLRFGATLPMLSNGASFDPQQGNLGGTLLASAARTVFTQAAVQTNYNGRGVQIGLNITVASGTGGLQVRVRGSDPITGGAYHLAAAPTAITATGLYVYEFYPGASQGAPGGASAVNLRQAASVPRLWSASVEVGDASSYTYSLSFALIV